MKYPDDFIDQVILGDSLEVLKEIPDNSVDTIITDPPYGLEFMGKEWDRLWDKRANTDYRRKGFGKGVLSAPVYAAGVQAQEFHFKWAKEVLRVAKPGAMLLAFGGTRTWHRLACGLEDAGWEIRDTLMWVYGSGFPKSLNISKAIDKMKGAEREVIGKNPNVVGRTRPPSATNCLGAGTNDNLTAPATPEAEMWEGYGTSLKPAYEPIILAMKPLDGTFAENALKWGVAGLNIDEARIGTEKVLAHHAPAGTFAGGEPNRGSDTNYYVNQGRFPANLLLDEASAEMLDEQSGKKIGNGHWSKTKTTGFGKFGNGKSEYFGVGEKDKSFGGASRFFYVAKASRSERDAGLEEFPERQLRDDFGIERFNTSNIKNNHPTVKPIKLMDYLVKLTKMPNPNQIYLDPFLGSGTTAIAVVLNGRHFIGIEKEQEYVEIAKARIKYWGSQAIQTFGFEEDNG